MVKFINKLQLRPEGQTVDKILSFKCNKRQGCRNLNPTKFWLNKTLFWAITKNFAEKLKLLEIQHFS